MFNLIFSILLSLGPDGQKALASPLGQAIERAYNDEIEHEILLACRALEQQRELFILDAHAIIERIIKAAPTVPASCGAPSVGHWVANHIAKPKNGIFAQCFPTRYIGGRSNPHSLLEDAVCGIRFTGTPSKYAVARFTEDGVTLSCTESTHRPMNLWTSIRYLMALPEDAFQQSPCGRAKAHALPSRAIPRHLAQYVEQGQPIYSRCLSLGKDRYYCITNLRGGDARLTWAAEVDLSGDVPEAQAVDPKTLRCEE